MLQIKVSSWVRLKVNQTTLNEKDSWVLVSWFLLLIKIINFYFVVLICEGKTNNEIEERTTKYAEKYWTSSSSTRNKLSKNCEWCMKMVWLRCIEVLCKLSRLLYIFYSRTQLTQNEPQLDVKNWAFRNA